MIRSTKSRNLMTERTYRHVREVEVTLARLDPILWPREGAGRGTFLYSLGEVGTASGEVEYAENGQVCRLQAVIVRRGFNCQYHETVSMTVTPELRQVHLLTSVSGPESSYFAGSWTLSENRGGAHYQYTGPQRLGLTELRSARQDLLAS